MPNSRFTWLPCTIENSGFSSERRFRTSVLPGEAVEGTAYVEYLRHQDRSPIRENEPAYEQAIDGWVACRLIRRERDHLVLEFPSMDVFRVPLQALQRAGFPGSTPDCESSDATIR